MLRRSPMPPTKCTPRWGALTGCGLRQHRSGYLPDRAQRLLERPGSGAMTVDALQDIVTRLSDEWGIDCPPITVDDTVTGQIGRVTQLRGRTTMAFEPAVLDLPVADAEVAVGHELGHLVHPAVPGSSLDGWRRGVLVLAAIGLVSLPLTLVLAPLLAVSVATEIVTAMFVVHWALVARIQRSYEFFADRYSAERLGGNRVADYLTGWVQAREPAPRGGRLSVRLNEIFATHPTIPQRAAAVRDVSVMPDDCDLSDEPCWVATFE
jgi:Zn-dependent protease with chaperone function